jgi:hypothetical protein
MTGTTIEYPSVSTTKPSQTVNAIAVVDDRALKAIGGRPLYFLSGSKFEFSIFRSPPMLHMKIEKKDALLRQGPKRRAAKF